MPRDPHAPSRALYNAVVAPTVIAGYHLAARFNAKARRGITGRRGFFERLQGKRDQLQGCVWMHASSVGEYEQARPVLRALREDFGDRLPTLQTVFSPSGYEFATSRCDADHLDYLPLDRASTMRRLVSELRPRAVVFLKFDCWPNLIWEARDHEAAVLLLDGTLHRKSHRLRGVARNFFGRLFDCFDAIGAISEEDAARFREGLGTRAPITVTGDTRTDQVVHRWRDAEDGVLATALAEAPFDYACLGSIWPADEAVVLDAALGTCSQSPDRGIVLVAHEPTEEALLRLERAAIAHDLLPTRLSQLFDVDERRLLDEDPNQWRCLLVDCVGVLAEIYRAMAFTYVGGSFSTGVHNVLEPAVCGQPVLFGPRIHNAYEAERLVEREAGFVIETPEQARARFEEFYSEPARRHSCGARAADFVLSQSGATAASVDLLRPFLAAH